MSRKFLFLVNPISGTKSKQSLPDLIAAAAQKHEARFDIFHTVASGDYSFIRQKIADHKYTDVIMCGGDGTVNTVVQQLLDTDVNFGIVPLGSGNGLALSARIPKQPVRALDLAFTGKASVVDAFSINGSFACMLCGLGFDAQVAHDFAKQKKRGLMTYAKQSLGHFLRATPYSFEIKMESTRFSTEAWFISIANSNQFGNNVTIAPRASLSDGLLDIVIVRKMSKARLPLALLMQVAGNNRVSQPEAFQKSGIIYLQTESLRIKNTDNAPLHIDGEPKNTAEEFEIKIIPGCFKLIQPAK
ncbi:MAG: YegS/Rv2252/BmrU family lipid kinase [Bacteroidetes bacterium]|nr:YegS/Rv2252/BmrU family lipid kinase [Bacteroidota bacterium]